MPHRSPGPSRHAVPLAVWMAAGAWLLLVGWGFVSYRGQGVLPRGNQMTVDRAVFTTVNAATLTGFQQSTATNDYGPRGRHTTFALMACGIVFTLFIGGCAVRRILDLPWRDGGIFLSAVVYLGLAIAWGMLLMLGEDADPFTAAFQATAAFGNCGLYIGRLATSLEWQTHAVLLPLALAGGLGLPVLMDLAGAARHRRPLQYHSQVVLWMTATLYLVGFAVLASLRVSLDDVPPSQAIAGASATAINARNAGLPIDPVTGYARAAQWVVMLLMLIGASPAGTGGGLKTTSVFEIAHGMRRALRHRAADRTFALALFWLISLVTLVGMAHLSLLITEPQLSADRVLFLAVSAATNTGLSHEPISLVGPGLYILSVTMLAGRIAPLLILWWLAHTADDAPLAVG